MARSETVAALSATLTPSQLSLLQSPARLPSLCLHSSVAALSVVPLLQISLAKFSLNCACFFSPSLAKLFSSCITLGGDRKPVRLGCEAEQNVSAKRVRALRHVRRACVFWLPRLAAARAPQNPHDFPSVVASRPHISDACPTAKKGFSQITQRGSAWGRRPSTMRTPLGKRAAGESLCLSFLDPDGGGRGDLFVRVFPYDIHGSMPAFHALGLAGFPDLWARFASWSPHLSPTRTVLLK